MDPIDFSDTQNNEVESPICCSVAPFLPGTLKSPWGRYTWPMGGAWPCPTDAHLNSHPSLGCLEIGFWSASPSLFLELQGGLCSMTCPAEESAQRWNEGTGAPGKVCPGTLPGSSSLLQPALTHLASRHLSLFRGCWCPWRTGEQGQDFLLWKKRSFTHSTGVIETHLTPGPVLGAGHTVHFCFQWAEARMWVSGMLQYATRWTVLWKQERGTEWEHGCWARCGFQYTQNRPDPEGGVCAKTCPRQG